jgi:hypothetical protein
MIEMACPRCGAGGRVPRDRAGSRLVCKKCLQVFHLGPGNKALIGEPPVQKEGHRDRERDKGSRERMELGLEMGALGEKLGKIKLPDPKTVGIVAGVMLAVAFFWWLFSKQTVEQRAETLAVAIRDLDMDTMMAMALPGTEFEAMKWMNDIVKDYMDLKLALGNINPGVKIQSQPTSDGSSAQTLLVFSREGATSTGPMSVEQAATLEPPKGSKTTMELVVYWTKDTWQVWRFDGNKTNEAATKAE